MHEPNTHFPLCFRATRGMFRTHQRFKQLLAEIPLGGHWWTSSTVFFRQTSSTKRKICGGVVGQPRLPDALRGTRPRDPRLQEEDQAEAAKVKRSLKRSESQAKKQSSYQHHEARACYAWPLVSCGWIWIYVCVLLLIYEEGCKYVQVLVMYQLFK